MSKAPPARFRGYGIPGSVYNAGEIVIRRGSLALESRVLMSKHDNNVLGVGGDWADLGTPGPSPTVVVHRWNPKDTCYPDPDDPGELSESVDLCVDCWKDADFPNAFRPEVHLYVIREVGLG